MPDVWLEGVTTRLIREAEPDDPWLIRCQHRLQRFRRNLKGNWFGWRKNLPLLALVAGLLMPILLVVRATGGLRWLPSPLGMSDKVLITAGEFEKDRVLKSDDLYPSFLPFENDYFRPDAKVDGLILAEPIRGNMPLRFRNVLRLQVVALADIQREAIITEDKVKLDWKQYQPGAALSLDEVVGRKANHSLRNNGVILSAFIKPAE